MEKREVIRRLRHGQPIRQINRDTDIYRTVIRQLKTLAKEKGWLAPKKKVPPELAIARLMKQDLHADQPHSLDRFNERIKK